MLKRFGLFALSSLFALSAPAFAHAATADLRVDPSDIRFSKSVLMVGDSVRIYTKIQNVGTADVTGYVTFYQGSSVISEPQVISLVSGGNPEEAFVDFVIPSGSFNIRAVVSGTKPAETNLDNNVAITGMITPVPDDDHDGISNASDDCPTVANSDQADTDHDGIGNACDDDIDSDTLTNAVEAELGTNPQLKDTDSDGVDDAHDAYPLDPKRSILEKPMPLSKPVTQPVSVTQGFSPGSPKVASNTNNTSAQSGSIETASNSSSTITGSTTTAPPSDPIVPTTVATSSKIHVSPNAVFTYEMNSWNTFTFRLIAPVQDKFVYEWNFGDGVHSSKTSLSHTYAQAGAYHVALKTTDDQGNVSEESADVQVTFFSLSNPFIDGLLVFLGLVLIGLSVAWFRTKTKKRSHKTDLETPVKQIHVQEE